MKLEIQVFTRPKHAVFDQLDVNFGHLGRFMSENVGDLFFNDIQVTLVDFSQ